MHSALFVLAFAAVASAKTNIAGCVSTKTTNQWGEASMLWYVPTDGEICDFLDCGGGRAPPKTTVPGCPLYEGTATYSPQYLAGFNAASTGASSSAAATTTAQSSPAVTSAAATSAIASSTSASSAEPAPSLTASSSASVISSIAAPSTAAAATTGATTASSSGVTTIVTQPSGNSTSSSSPATSSTLTPVNAGSVKSVGVISALLGGVAAGFAFLL